MSKLFDSLQARKNLSKAVRPADPAPVKLQGELMKQYPALAILFGLRASVRSMMFSKRGAGITVSMLSAILNVKPKVLKKQILKAGIFKSVAHMHLFNIGILVNGQQTTKHGIQYAHVKNSPFVKAEYLPLFLNRYYPEVFADYGIEPDDTNEFMRMVYAEVYASEEYKKMYPKETLETTNEILNTSI